MAEAPYWTGVSVRAPRPTLAASGHEAAVWGQLGHQSARVSRHRHDPKPLQFHRRLDQTFQEHESPLRYPGCVTTPKYLMRLMFFNSQPSSACIHLYDEPKVLFAEGKAPTRLYHLHRLSVPLCLLCRSLRLQSGLVGGVAMPVGRRNRPTVAAVPFFGPQFSGRDLLYLQGSDCRDIRGVLAAGHEVYLGGDHACRSGRALARGDLRTVYSIRLAPGSHRGGVWISGRAETHHEGHNGRSDHRGG